MGWSQLIAAVLGMLGGGLLGKGSGSAVPAQSAAQDEMQTQILDLLRSQKNDYLYAQPLRNHITDTADWLLPKQSRVSGQSSDPFKNKHTDPPIRDVLPPDQPTDQTDLTKNDPAGGPQRFQASSPAPPTSPSADGMDYLAKYLAKFSGARG